MSNAIADAIKDAFISNDIMPYKVNLVTVIHLLIQYLEAHEEALTDGADKIAEAIIDAAELLKKPSKRHEISGPDGKCFFCGSPVVKATLTRLRVPGLKGHLLRSHLKKIEAVL